MLKINFPEKLIIYTDAFKSVDYEARYVRSMDTDRIHLDMSNCMGEWDNYVRHLSSNIVKIKKLVPKYAKKALVNCKDEDFKEEELDGYIAIMRTADKCRRMIYFNLVEVDKSPVVIRLENDSTFDKSIYEIKRIYDTNVFKNHSMILITKAKDIPKTDNLKLLYEAIDITDTDKYSYTEGKFNLTVLHRRGGVFHDQVLIEPNPPRHREYKYCPYNILNLDIMRQKLANNGITVPAITYPY